MKKSQEIVMKSCLMFVLVIVLPVGGAWSHLADQGTVMASAADLMALVVAQSAETRMALEENPDTDTDLKNDTGDVDTGMKNDTGDVDKSMQNDMGDVDTDLKNDTGDVDTGTKDDTGDVDKSMENDTGDIDTDMQESN